MFHNSKQERAKFIHRLTSTIIGLYNAAYDSLFNGKNIFCQKQSPTSPIIFTLQKRPPNEYPRLSRHQPYPVAHPPTCPGPLFRQAPLMLTNRRSALFAALFLRWRHKGANRRAINLNVFLCLISAAVRLTGVVVVKVGRRSRLLVSGSDWG